MHFHCAGSAEWLIGCELTDQPGADDADESALGDESQTTTAAHHGALLAFRKATPEGPVAVVSLAKSTKYAWAAGRSGPTAAGTCSCAGRRARGWACRGPMVQALTDGAPPYRIALYGNPIADWAAGAVRLWLVRKGAAALPGGVSLTGELAGTPLDLAVHQTPTSAASGQQQQQDQTAPPGQQEQQQQQQSHRPGRTPQVQVPYSVPALAVGDVFLSCNTVAGLEHADDWDLGSLGSRLVGGGTASSSSASQAPPGSRQSPLDPASELLLRMSAPVGGQRLMFVSKESAELVRRALLLSRYDEIMERRAEAKEEAEAREGAAAAAGAGAAPSTRLVVSTSAATGTRVPRVAGAAGGTGGAAGWGAAWRGAEGAASGGGGGGHSDGADEDRPRPPFAPWPRKPITDRAPARSTSPVVPPANPKAVTDPKSTQEANPNLVNGSGSVALSGGSATGAHDSLHLVMPGWVPGPVREVATAVARGVGGWWAHAGGDAAAAASGVPQGVAALFKRGAAGGGIGGVLDVSPGPRARLPAPPLTHAMQLPPLAPVAAGEEERRQQSLEGEAAARRSGPAEAAAGPSSTGTRAAADRTRWDGEALMRELKQLEEEKVIADAEALLQAGRRGAAGGGGADGDSGGGGFLPPFSFSSYVARLPLEAALKAILSTPTAAAAAAAAASSAAAADPAAAAEASEAAGVAHAAAVDAAVAPALAAVPVRPRFFLCPDLADEQAVEGSREVDRLVAELEAAAAAAAAAGAEDVARAETRAEAEKPADAGPGGGVKGVGGAAAVRAASGRSASSSGGAANGRRAGPRPRVALNLYDSDASHWVLDVVDKLEHDSSEAGGDSNSTTTTTTGGASGGGSSSGSSGSRPAALPTERFIRGTPGGPSEDLGGLVQLPTPREPSAAVTGLPKAAGLNASAAEPGPALGHGNVHGGGGGGRTPVFLLPGVTISVRAADGTLLRLRPAFLALPQLAAVLALLRDAVATSWRRQRSAARWKVVSALDVLTVHSAGFPIMRVPPVSKSAGGAAGASGGGGAGNGADEDSDEALPEAKELLREMGAGNRRPSAADTAAAAAASPSTHPSGPLAVLSTLAVGVVSFSSWCIASAVDVWEDVYFRTPWGLEEMGLPQHINVTPTYLEDHVRHLAEANAPAVAAAATAARVRTVQRVLEWRARRRQAQAREQQQLLQQLQQDPPHDTATSTDGERQHGALAAGPALEQTAGSAAATAVDDGGAAAVAPTGAQAPQSTAGPAAGGAAREAATPASIPTDSKAVTDPAEAVVAAVGDGGGGAAAGTGHSQGGNRHRTATPAAATATPYYSGLSLQTESMAGLSLLLQFVWAGMCAAQVQVQKDGVLSSDLGGGGGSVDGLLRLAGAGGRGLTMTASQSGEVDVVAKLDVRPVASAPAAVSPAAAATASKAAASAASAGAAAKPEPANANGEVAAVRPAAAGAGAGGESTSAPPPPEQQQRSGPASAAPVTPTAAAPPTAASAPPAASKTGGLLIRELGPTSESGIRYELMHSSAKLASQVTRPHKFEVGLHVNLHKLLGDTPEDAPDTLLKLQQPARPTPSGVGAASGGVGASAAGAARRGASGQASTFEAQGLILIGDLGLDEVDEGALMLPPSMGFADLGGLLLPPPPPPPAGQWRGSAAAAAAAAAALAMGDYGEGGSLEGKDSGGSEAAAGGMGGGGGTSRAGSGGGSRGWAAGGPRRGAWGRWGR